MSDNGYDQMPGQDGTSQPGATPPPPPPGLFPPAAQQPVQQPASPTAPPAAPPTAYAPPPATPMQAAYAPPPSTAPAKKRTGLIIGLVALFIVLCGVGGCAALLIGGLSGGGDKAIIGQAESHYDAVQSAVTSASALVEGAREDDAEVDTAINDAQKALRVARDEIMASRVAIEQIDDSEGKTAYLVSLTAATETVDGLEDLLAYLLTASAMTEKVSDASAAATSGNDNINDAITAGNSSSYAKMKREAKKASADFKKAAALFREAHEMDESAGLDKSARYQDKRREVAVVVIKMSDDGKAGRTSAYNKGIAKMKSLNKAAEKIGEPEIVSDSNWTQKRLADLNNTVSTAAGKADEAHAKALVALGYSE